VREGTKKDGAFNVRAGGEEAEGEEEKGQGGKNRK